MVAAHPDDEVLGCGATMARLAREGHVVHVAILGEGVTSRYRRREEAPPEALEALEQAGRRVATALGAKTTRFFRLPDNRFDTQPLLEIVHRVEAVVDELAPDVVYTHHPADLNIDHALTFRAVLTATRPRPGCAVRDLYAFEVPSSTEWTFGRGERAFQPNVFVDVSATMELKIEAMAMYEGEMRAWPHPRSAEALRVIARRWGAVVAADHVEAFELVRSLR